MNVGVSISVTSCHKSTRAIRKMTSTVMRPIKARRVYVVIGCRMPYPFAVSNLAETTKYEFSQAAA
jgi:hypothetical protein